MDEVVVFVAFKHHSVLGDTAALIALGQLLRSFQELLPRPGAVGIGYTSLIKHVFIVVEDGGVVVPGEAVELSLVGEDPQQFVVVGAGVKAVPFDQLVQGHQSASGCVAGYVIEEHDVWSGSPGHLGLDAVKIAAPGCMLGFYLDMWVGGFEGFNDLIVGRQFIRVAPERPGNGHWFLSNCQCA